MYLRLIHHRKHHESIIKVWYREIIKTSSARKLTFLYLVNFYFSSKCNVICLPYKIQFLHPISQYKYCKVYVDTECASDSDLHSMACCFVFGLKAMFATDPTTPSNVACFSCGHYWPRNYTIRFQGSQSLAYTAESYFLQSKLLLRRMYNLCVCVISSLTNSR